MSLWCISIQDYILLQLIEVVFWHMQVGGLIVSGSGNWVEEKFFCMGRGSSFSIDESFG